MASEHYDKTGKCLYCDIVRAEARAGDRVVEASSHFLVFCPYAARLPFETWIVPKSPAASLARVPDEELHRFGVALRDALRRLYIGLNNPDFNHVLHTSARGDESEPHLCWHLRIYPRFTAVAGFEIGSGIHINTSVPEDTALFMRGVALSERRT